MRKLYKFFILAIIIFCFNFVYAQLTIQAVTPFEAASYLIDINGGVTLISNVTFNGDALQIKKFSNGINYFGYNDGVIISTGNASYVTENNNSDRGGSRIIPSAVAGNDIHLDQLLTPGTTPTQFLMGPTILEFDIIPQGTQINFDFVFGSAEYNEHDNDQFNDVFGIFISGPGIIGNFGYGGYGGKNIALVPGTSDFISVRTLNDHINSNFFINNETNYSQTSLVYDGYTIPINASCQVQCGQTYHIRIGISNVCDKLLESGVMLRRGSIKSDIMSPIVAEPQIVCEGENINLSVPNPNGSWQYSWSCGQNGSSVTTTANSNTSEYTVTATVSSGCTITQSIGVNVHSLNNLQPYVNGINNTGEYTAYVIAGQQVLFDIPSFDSPNEAVSISWNGGINGASFDNNISGDIVAQHKKGRFSWTPSTSQLGTYAFTVTVTDDNRCDFLSQTFTFKIAVICPLCNIDKYYENRTPSNNPLPSETKAGHRIIAGTSVDPTQVDGPVNTGNAVVIFRAPEIILESGFSSGPGFRAISDDETCLNSIDCSCCNNWSGFTFDFIPNVFTPDGDGINEIWYLPDVYNPFCAFNATEFELTIKNSVGTTYKHEIGGGLPTCCQFVAPNPIVNHIPHSSIYWDGRYLGGQLGSDGVYYMTLTLKGCGHTAYYNSSITLFGPTKSIQTDTTNVPVICDFFNDSTSMIQNGVQNISNKVETINIYPNPTNSIVYVELSDIGCAIKLFSLEGQLLYEKKSCNNKEMIDLNNFENGTYFIKIVSGDKIYEQKVIKQ